MINIIQKNLYKLSSAAPMAFIAAISMYARGLNKGICIIVAVIGVCIMIYSLIFLNVCKMKLPIITIKVDSVAPNDIVAIAYIVSYILPIVGSVWVDNLLLYCGIICITIVFLFRMQIMNFNPILLLIGYHCYKITLNSGITDCLLISKRKGIRSKNQIHRIVRIEDFLLIDCEGER